MKRTTVYTVLLLALLAGGCGRHDDAGDTRVDNSRLASQPVQEATHTGSTGTVARVVEKHLDTTLKLLDDFSAALRLQYARLSYDTNRVLTAAHTNYLSRLPHDEFLDFVRDFYRTCFKREMGAEEWSLIFLLTSNRLCQMASTGDMNGYHHLADDTLNMALYARDGRSSTIAREWLRASAAIALEGGAVDYICIAMGHVIPRPDHYSLPVVSDYIAGILPESRAIADNARLAALLTEKDRLHVQLCVAQLECFADTGAALVRLSSIREAVKRVWSTKRSMAVGIDARIEGLSRGMHGQELDEYVWNSVGGATWRDNSAAPSAPISP